MQKSRFLHFLLILALCVGQIAANSHVIGHVQSAAHHSGLANQFTAHSEDHQHHHFSLEYANPVEHQHHHAGVEDANPGKAENDCGVYHAFAGAAGIVPAECNTFAVRLSRSVVPIPEFIIVAGSTTDAHSIRGPPLTPEYT